MEPTLDDLRSRTGRAPAELTRRDLARGLLSVSPASARAALPELRRGLIAAGNPLSPPFWDAAERQLGEIVANRATVGQVHRWVQATGTEPIALLAGGFVWPEEDERGPVAGEMHARLVTHLERLVADGTIDPDRLAADDPRAWTEYERLQLEWLQTPLPDGREPMWAVSDEEDEEFLALWDEAESDAREILAELLADTPSRPRPEADLVAACRRLRAGLHSGDWPYDLLRAAAGVDPAALPADDGQLWLTLGAGVVTCQEEPPAGLDDGVQAAWMALDHPDWIGAVVTLVRGGIGTAADAHSLAGYAAAFDFEESGGDDGDPWDDEPFDDGWSEDGWFEDDTADDQPVLAAGFGIVTLLWSVLGAVDADEHLTRLGWWGLPETLTRAWSPD